MIAKSDRDKFTPSTLPKKGNCGNTRANRILQLKNSEDFASVKLDYGNPKVPTLRVLNCSDIATLDPDLQGAVHSVPFSKNKAAAVLTNNVRALWRSVGTEDIQYLLSGTPADQFRIAYISRLQSSEQHEGCSRLSDDSESSRQIRADTH